jgi:heme oxygenase
MREDEDGLAAALRRRTESLHRQAERTGYVRRLLLGQGSRQGYALLLRNLLLGYQELERGLERHRLRPGVREIAQPALYRVTALEADLRALCGFGWRRELPTLPAGERYMRRVADAAEGSGARLIGHAYVRYLGDLSGGQIMKRLLARSLGSDARTLALYDFPEIADLRTFKAGFRCAIDRAGSEIDEAGAVIEEAAEAFRLNIAVSLAVEDATA